MAPDQMKQKKDVQQGTRFIRGLLYGVPPLDFVAVAYECAADGVRTE